MSKKNSKAVLLSSIKMAVATFCSRILGLVREQVMAATFGASGLTDAFLVAYRIPNLLRDLFAEGAFSSAFVPTFIEQNQIGKEKARQLLWALFILLGLTTLFFSGVIFVFAEELISVFAPSFKQDPEKFEITVNLTKIMSPFLLFVSIAALFMGVLNSLKVFFIPSLAPAFFNITMIVCMIVLPGYFISQDIPAVYSLGVGAFFGGLIQALVQIPLIIKKGFSPTKPKQVFTKESKKVVKLLGPGLIGFAATQVNMLITTILASGTIVGAVSWLSYAFRMFQLPVGILGVSIGNSNLVHFSAAWKDKNFDKARELVGGSYFLSVFLVLPPMVGLLVFNDEIIKLVFERGKFSPDSTMQTAKALKWYALGLPFYGIYKIFVPTFYAIDRQKIPVYCSIFSIAANIAFCILLTPIYGFEVLAFGTTLSMFLNSSVQTYILKNDLQVKLSHFLSFRIMKVIFAAFLTYIAASQVKTILVFDSQTFVLQTTELFLNLSFVVLCYGILVFAFGERRFVLSFLNKIKNKL